MEDTNEVRKLSPALKSVLDNVPKVHDANGTLDLGITAVGFLEAILRENLMTVPRLTAWLNENVVVGRDVGPGAEQESANLFSGLLTSLRKGQNGAGSGPVDPSAGTNGDGRQALTVEEALAYADRGYTWRGTLALDDAALSAAKAELAGGIPTASPFRDFDLDAVKILRYSGMITGLYADDGPWRDPVADGAPMSAAQIFAQQVLVSGGGRGPSGDAGATEAGPGVVS